MENHFEQYKIAIETAEKTTDRRYSFNKFMISILTALLAAIATIASRGHLLLISPLCIAGICVCLVWKKQIQYFKKMIKIKYAVIKKMENEYNLFKTYHIEGEQREDYQNQNKFKSFSEQEKELSSIFIIGFILYIIAIILHSFFGINSFKLI